MTKPAAKPNRNPIKNFFITFPQTEEDKEVFARKFDYTFASCAQETHEDGNHHLHLLVALKVKITKSKLLLKIQELYPNDYKRIDVQATRVMANVLTYIKKEDLELFEDGIPAFGTRKKKKINIPAVRKKLLEDIPNPIKYLKSCIGTKLLYDSEDEEIMARHRERQESRKKEIRKISQIQDDITKSFYSN